MTCDCRKHAPDPDCERPDHSSEPWTTAVGDELARLRAERQQAIDALRELTEAVERENRTLLNPSKSWPMSQNVKQALWDANRLLSLGEKP